MDIIEINPISKRTKAPPPPLELKKTEQDMSNMEATNGHAASRNGNSSTNGTKQNTRNLRVHMPSGKIVNATVDATLSSSDLLVMMAGKNKLNPVSHMMKVPSNNPLEDTVPLKPSQCVGDINGDVVFLIAKAQKDQFSIKREERKSASFEKTIRLTVNYGSKHKMVLRINPDRTLADLLPQICDEKGVESKYHTLRHPKAPSDDLDLRNSLTSYETNELLLMDTRAPKQESSYMPELAGDKKKKSFFGKLKKKKTGFDLEQAPTVNVSKSGGISPTSPTRQRPSTISGGKPPAHNSEISRTQTARKRAAPKPPSVKKADEAASSSTKPVSRKKKAPAPPRPDEPPKSPTEDPPKMTEAASASGIDDHNLSIEESVEVEIHTKPNDEEEVSPKTLNRRSSQRPLSPPPPPPEQDDIAQFSMPVPKLSELKADDIAQFNMPAPTEPKADRPTFVPPPPPDEPPPEDDTDDQSICSSQNSEGDEEKYIDPDTGVHVECTCNHETGEHECILHKPQVAEATVTESKAGDILQSGSHVEPNDKELNREENTLPSDDLSTIKLDAADEADGNDMQLAVVDAVVNLNEDDDKQDVEVNTLDEVKVETVGEVKVETVDKVEVETVDEVEVETVDEVEVETVDEVKKFDDEDVDTETVKICDTKIDNLKEMSEESIELKKPDKVKPESNDKMPTDKVVNGNVSNVSTEREVTNSQKSTVTDVEVKDLQIKYELLQQQFATLQQQMINSQQNMLEQQKVQTGAMSAQELLALQAQQMQQIIQQQMLLQSQGMMNVQKTTMQADKLTVEKIEEKNKKLPQDLPRKLSTHSEIPKKVQPPEADKDLASAFRSLKQKSKPTKHSYIFSAAMRPRTESDAAKSTSVAGYETKRRSDSFPDTQPTKTTEPVKPVQSNVDVVNETNCDKLSPKEAIVHPNVVIIEKTQENPKSENGVLSGRSSSIPQATVAPQPSSKPVPGRSGNIIAYLNPRAEELQDIQTTGNVSKFRQMFAGNNT